MKRFLLIILLFNFNILSTKAETFFLDVDYLINNSNKGKIIVEKLKSINIKNIEELKKKEQELETLENEISSTKNIISDEELNNKIKNLKKEISSYRISKEKKTNEFNVMRNKELNVFFNEIRPFIEEYMKENSINLILDKKNIFIADSNYDITIELTNYLNSKTE